MAYFNTTQLSGSDLSTAIGNAKGQDERILDYFKENPSKLLTPDDVLEAIFTARTPITSIRRSFTELTDGLFLEKTKQMRVGRYGKPCHCWKLRTINNQLSLI